MRMVGGKEERVALRKGATTDGLKDEIKRQSLGLIAITEHFDTELRWMTVSPLLCAGTLPRSILANLY